MCPSCFYERFPGEAYCGRCGRSGPGRHVPTTLERAASRRSNRRALVIVGALMAAVIVVLVLAESLREEPPQATCAQMISDREVLYRARSVAQRASDGAATRSADRALALAEARIASAGCVEP